MGKSKFVHSSFHWFALSFHRWLIFIANFFFFNWQCLLIFCFKFLSAPLFMWVTIYKTFPLAGDLLIYCMPWLFRAVGWSHPQSPTGNSTLPNSRSNPTQINHQKQTLIPPLICHLPHWHFLFLNPLLFRFGVKANLRCVCLCALE